MSATWSKVAIPFNLKKMIENIKEITGNHSEEEIYSMLKECCMDPNETAQKLLLQDPFHEVKRRRDRKKEKASNKESVQSQWRTSTQGRGARGGREIFVPRYMSHDDGSGPNSSYVKENGINPIVEKGVSPSLLTSHETKYKERNQVTSSVPVIGNGVADAASGGSVEITFSSGINKMDSQLYPADTNKRSTSAFGFEESQPTHDLVNCTASIAPASADHVLVPSNDLWLTGSGGPSKHEMGTQRPLAESINPVENKLTTEASEISSSLVQGKTQRKSQDIGKNQLSEFSQSSTLTHGGSLISRPTSNHSNRPQQTIGSQKVGSYKEWKPKPTTSVVVQGSGTVGTTGVSGVPIVSIETTTGAQLQPASSGLNSKDATSKLQKKLEELHLQQSQHVILPNNIHIPESQRPKLSFGSFDASFGVTPSYVTGPETDKGPTPVSETSQGVDETADELTSSNQNALATSKEGNYTNCPQTPTHVPENLSSDNAHISSDAIHENLGNALPYGVNQSSAVHTSAAYNFGLVPPVIGGQLPAFEDSYSQARDISHLANFVAQPPADPTNYYVQFYRSDADADVRHSPPFPSPSVSAKYNGNVASKLPHTSQSPQEGGFLSTSGPTALVTQSAGLMQSSIPVTQQPVPVFRPPTGVHLSHYPPNYFPYGHYFSPFYVPPPAIHQFLGNNAFPHQPQAGSIYAAPPPATSSGIKYPHPQYKMGTNSGNSTYIGMSNSYGAYGSSSSGFNSSSAATGGNSTTHEDLGASQFKENNVYITGPQSEGSAVWVAAPGRENLPPSSLYNLPPQGQHVTFTPTQTVHGSFANMYHPGQAVTAATFHPLLQQSQMVAGDMVGPGASVYQQPQHVHVNWPSNY